MKRHPIFLREVFELRSVLLVGFACLLGASACAEQPKAAGTRTSQDAARQQREVEVPRTVVTPTDTSSIPELLQKAAALANAQRWKEAAAQYELAYRLEPEGAFGSEALWGAADAHDRANELEPALARYELFAQREPESPHAHDALVRITRLAVFLNHFTQAGTYADRLLKSPEPLSDTERIAVLSARALALIEGGEAQQASYFIEKGRDIVDAHQLDAAGKVPRDLAQLYYALGELRRFKAERIVFQPMPPNFGAVLEERCQLLLDAQSAYADSMRAYDAHWSAMAGYRTVELYQKLHEDLLAVKAPPSADTERKQQLFEGAVRTRYAILLTKARALAQSTLGMAERTGEKSEWVDRTREALKAIDQAVKDEEAALAKLPYTKQDFEAYFAQMDAAAAPPKSTSPSKPAPSAKPAPNKSPAPAPKPINP
ncbi:MAG TPA: hypothetical protein VEQ58_07405 [Polyangiaceae bacterium]|nr:hypothetical protein [Polyangiaceae bacterium]